MSVEELGARVVKEAQILRACHTRLKRRMETGDLENLGPFAEKSGDSDDVIQVFCELVVARAPHFDRHQLLKLHRMVADRRTRTKKLEIMLETLKSFRSTE
jgi:hypothetical protein